MYKTAKLFTFFADQVNVGILYSTYMYMQGFIQDFIVGEDFTEVYLHW